VRGDQLARQWQLIQRLARSRYGVHLDELAEDLGCVRRTVYRDLDALMLAGFPVVSEKRDGRVYYRFLDTFRLGDVPFTPDEILALVFGEDLLRALEGTVFHDSIRSAISKIRAGLSPELAEYLAPRYRSLAINLYGYGETTPWPRGKTQSLDDQVALITAMLDATVGDEPAHIVGHSMGAATALHVGIHYPERCLSVTAAGCGYGSSPDPKVVEETRAASRETAKMFARETMAVSAARYGDGPTRQAHKNKDPRGYAEFVRMLSEHSPEGHALVMENLQAKRPTLWDMEADLRKFKPPLLVLVGDEDEWCVDASIFLRRIAPTAGLCVIPRSGHTITSEEPDKFNAAVSELIAAAEAGRWLAHKP